MKSVHFSFGDSTEVVIGFCAQVRADSDQEAVKILAEALPVEVKVVPLGNAKDADRIGYIRVYLTPENVKVDDIDEVNDEG